MKYLVAALLGTLWIPVPQYGNASLIEIIWFAVGLIALLVSSISIPIVIGDYAVSKEVVRFTTDDVIMAQARVLMARGQLRREIIRLAQAFIIFIIGVEAMLQPNPVHHAVTLTGLFVTIGLVTLAILVVFQSGLDHLQRKHADELIRKEEE